MKALFWGHMGWIFVQNPKMSNAAAYDRYAKDVFSDPFNMKLERNLLWLWIYVIHAIFYYLVGFFTGWTIGGTLIAGIQFGLSLLVWGVFLRTVLVWHITWSVNSFGHVWGYQNYKTRGNSQNNLLIGLISNGDGWHNNHHFDQRAAAHGHKWWEVDVTYLTIMMMKALNLAWDIVPVSSQ